MFISFKTNLPISKENILCPSVRVRVKHLGSLWKINTGQGLTEVRVVDTMIGHCFGEFIFTKKLGNSIHKKNKKNKKK